MGETWRSPTSNFVNLVNEPDAKRFLFSVGVGFAWSFWPWTWTRWGNRVTSTSRDRVYHWNLRVCSSPKTCELDGYFRGKFTPKAVLFSWCRSGLAFAISVCKWTDHARIVTLEQAHYFFCFLVNALSVFPRFLQFIFITVGINVTSFKLARMRPTLPWKLRNFPR